MPVSVCEKRTGFCDGSKKINETMQRTGITKWKKKLLFLKSAKNPLDDVGARKHTVTIKVSITLVVAASLRKISHFGIEKFIVPDNESFAFCPPC